MSCHQRKTFSCHRFQLRSTTPLAWDSDRTRGPYTRLPDSSRSTPALRCTRSNSRVEEEVRTHLRDSLSNRCVIDLTISLYSVEMIYEEPLLLRVPIISQRDPFGEFVQPDNAFFERYVMKAQPLSRGDVTFQVEQALKLWFKRVNMRLSFTHQFFVRFSS
jgi:hypothetical protein